MDTIATDVLIIGGGIAGLAFALELPPSLSVAVLLRSDTSASALAQGGMAAALAEDDTVELHICDTETAGDGLCTPDAVRIIAGEAPDAVRRLIALGARFDRTPDGRLHLHREGGHSRHRIVHSGDSTGREITRVLADAVRHRPGIRLFRDHTALDLLLHTDGSSSACGGAWAFDTATRHLRCFTARATVLCTGGAGQMYSHTTTPGTATGDGIAIAYRAGAALRHVEFVQFHPTALRTQPPLLLTEALRGAGASLCLADGTTFMEHYHALGSLAPRDTAARAVYRESLLHPDGVFLDARRLGAQRLRADFPTVVAHCAAAGIDPAADLIPITPAAHYLCGGVATDLDGRTSISGLYACGETACTGLHGANRLASNSLTEALVVARRAAAHAAAALHTYDCPERPAVQPPYRPPAATDTCAEARALSADLRTLMWNTVGIVRTMRGLDCAVGHTLRLLRDAEDLFFTRPLGADTAVLRNLALAAHLTARAARTRTHSRGAHTLAPDTGCEHLPAGATGDSDARRAVERPCPRTTDTVFPVLFIHSNRQEDNHVDTYQTKLGRTIQDQDGGAAENNNTRRARTGY